MRLFLLLLLLVSYPKKLLLKPRLRASFLNLFPVIMASGFTFMSFIHPELLRSVYCKILRWGRLLPCPLAYSARYFKLHKGSFVHRWIFNSLFKEGEHLMLSCYHPKILIVQFEIFSHYLMSSSSYEVLKCFWVIKHIRIF